MPQLIRTPATWLIYVQLGLYAYFLYGFGPMVAVLRDEQGVSNTLASLHSTALAVGAVAGGVAFPALTRRFGRATLMWGGVYGMAAGAAGFLALPPAYPVTLALTTILAFCGSSIINGVVVSLTHLHGPAGSAAISEANAMAVAVGMVAPLILGASLGAGLGWQGGIALLLGLIAVVAVTTRLTRVRLPARAAETQAVTIRAPLGKAYWLAWTMMVMTGAIEVVLSLWTAIVLQERVAMRTAAAAAAVSVITAGMLIGRVGGARLALRLQPIPLYFGALAVSLAGFALFWLSQHPALAIAGLLVTGMGNGMHYPLGIALALAVTPGQSDRAAGAASYGMGISFGIGPFVLGILADEVGTHTALLLVPLFIAAAAALAWWLRLTTAPTPAPANQPA